MGKDFEASFEANMGHILAKKTTKKAEDQGEKAPKWNLSTGSYAPPGLSDFLTLRLSLDTNGRNGHTNPSFVVAHSGVARKTRIVSGEGHGQRMRSLR